MFLLLYYRKREPSTNEVHWNSINLEGTVPDDLMKEITEKSYNIGFLEVLPLKISDFAI